MQQILLVLAVVACAYGFRLDFWKDTLGSLRNGTLDRDDFRKLIKERISNRTMDLLKKGMTGVDLEQRFQKLRRFANRHRVANLTEEQKQELHQRIAKIKKIVTEKPPGENTTDLFEVNELSGISDFLFQGDIHLTEEQLEELDNVVEGNSENKGAREKRAASSVFNKWTNGIVYYYLDASISSNPVKVASINAAIQYLQARTCIRFQQSTASVARIKVFSGAGCYATIGMTGRQQELSIGDGCEVMGTVAHEFTHALGFWHTHMRSDRDDYVTVDTRPVPDPNTASNFAKLKASENILYTPYEYGSFMHYGANAFSSNGQYTIVPKDNKYIYTMGNRMVSFYDVKMINDHYGCSAKCPAATSAKCQNAGVPNPNNCATCNCPLGYSGALCTVMPAATGGCGGELTATTAWQLKAFQYGKNSNTVRNVFTECHHWVKAPAGSRVQVRITDMSNTQCNLGCPFQGVEFKLNNPQMTNPRICCDKFRNVVYTSDLNPLPVIAFNRYGITRFTIEYRYVPGTGVPVTSPPVTTARLTTRAAVTTVRTTTKAVSSANCMDNASNCAALVNGGYCNGNQYNFQGKKYNCAKSCNLCKKKANPCTDLEAPANCSYLKSSGQCRSLAPLLAEYYCANTCGFCANPN